MFENIKSSYILKIIFSFINEKRKADLIKYNKFLQNENNININNYKSLSRKHILFENNGKGKIYDNYDNKLLYEGELLRGKKNGQGKEYDDNGKLIFIGKF